MPKLTKGKGQSAYPKDDHNNNTAKVHMGDLTLTKAQGIEALDQVADLTEFVTDITGPADAGDSKKKSSPSLQRSQRNAVPARVQWLTDNLVLYYPLL